MGNIRGAMIPRNFPKAGFFPVLVRDVRITGRSCTFHLRTSR
jgi:hypothetical protein